MGVAEGFGSGIRRNPKGTAAMDELWRSGCQGGSPGVGRFRVVERAGRGWGGEPSTLGGEEGLRGEDEMVVEASASAALGVVKADLVLDLLEAALDSPAHLD